MKHNLDAQTGKRNMQVGGEQRIDAPREVVWAALHDPVFLRQCIPGWESIARISDTEIRAVTTVNVGSTAGRFNSRMTLSTMDPPETCRIAGESQGGSAGFATGDADLRLEVVGVASTLLKYQVDAVAGGTLAQLGERLIDRSARKAVSHFCARLNDALTGRKTEPDPATEFDPATEPDPAGEPGPTPEPAVRENFGPAFWLAITVVLITLVLYMMALM